MIGSSEDEVCAFLAQDGLSKLLDSNLPAKYWVMGSLDSTDTIVNMDFYDAGPVRSFPVVYEIFLNYVYIVNPVPQ